MKWVCKVLVNLENKGELIEEITRMERDFAKIGNGRRGAKAASMCKQFDQSVCPV